MDIVNWIREGIARPRAAIYMKVLAVFMLLGALSHLGNIMGVTGVPWGSKPWQLRSADLLLLAVNLVLAWGMWRTKFWSVVGWVAWWCSFRPLQSCSSPSSSHTAPASG
jgi:hypothetical protein